MYGRPSKRMRRIKPVARVGAVDINVRYDIYGRQTLKNQQGNGCPDECYDILEGEVLFKLKQGSFYRENSLHLLSCTNGLVPSNYADLSLEEQQQIQRDIQKMWEPCGVAVTGFSPKVDVYEQGFVLQVSGLTTIYNNSGGSINAGDSVFVNLELGNPVNNPTGVPLSKNLLVLNKLEGKLIGTCVKGGRNKESIDVVLHRCTNSSAFAPSDKETGARFSTSDARNSSGSLTRKPAASSAAPAKKSRKKSSK